MPALAPGAPSRHDSSRRVSPPVDPTVAHETGRPAPDVLGLGALELVQAVVVELCLDGLEEAAQQADGDGSDALLDPEGDPIRARKVAGQRLVMTGVVILRRGERRRGRRTGPADPAGEGRRQRADRRRGRRSWRREALFRARRSPQRGVAARGAPPHDRGADPPYRSRRPGARARRLPRRAVSAPPSGRRHR